MSPEKKLKKSSPIIKEYESGDLSRDGSYLSPPTFAIISPLKSNSKLKNLRKSEKQKAINTS